MTVIERLGARTVRTVRTITRLSVGIITIGSRGEEGCTFTDTFERPDLGPGWTQGPTMDDFAAEANYLDAGAYVCDASGTADPSSAGAGGIRTTADSTGDQFIEAVVGNIFQGHDPAIPEQGQYVEGEFYLFTQVDPNSEACLMAWCWIAVGTSTGMLEGQAEIDLIRLDAAGNSTWYSYGTHAPLTDWRSNPTFTLRLETTAAGHAKGFFNGALLVEDDLPPVTNGRHAGVGMHWVRTNYGAGANPGTSLRVEEVSLTCGLATDFIEVVMDRLAPPDGSGAFIELYLGMTPGNRACQVFYLQFYREVSSIGTDLGYYDSAGITTWLGAGVDVPVADWDAPATFRFEQDTDGTIRGFVNGVAIDSVVVPGPTSGPYQGLTLHWYRAAGDPATWDPPRILSARGGQPEWTDDFERPNGTIGPDWTRAVPPPDIQVDPQDFSIVSGAAQGPSDLAETLHHNAVMYYAPGGLLTHHLSVTHDMTHGEITAQPDGGLILGVADGASGRSFRVNLPNPWLPYTLQVNGPGYRSLPPPIYRFTVANLPASAVALKVWLGGNGGHADTYTRDDPDWRVNLGYPVWLQTSPLLFEGSGGVGYHRGGPAERTGDTWGGGGAGSTAIALVHADGTEELILVIGGYGGRSSDTRPTDVAGVLYESEGGEGVWGGDGSAGDPHAPQPEVPGSFYISAEGKGATASTGGAAGTTPPSYNASPISGVSGLAGGIGVGGTGRSGTVSLIGETNNQTGGGGGGGGGGHGGGGAGFVIYRENSGRYAVLHCAGGGGSSMVNGTYISGMTTIPNFDPSLPPTWPSDFSFWQMAWTT